jgi:hypothetical protein
MTGLASYFEAQALHAGLQIAPFVTRPSNPVTGAATNPTQSDAPVPPSVMGSFSGETVLSQATAASPSVEDMAAKTVQHSLYYVDDYNNDPQATLNACLTGGGGIVQFSGKAYGGSMVVPEGPPVWVRGRNRWGTQLYSSGPTQSNIKLTGNMGNLFVTDITLVGNGTATAGAAIEDVGSGTPGVAVANVLAFFTYYGIRKTGGGAAPITDHFSPVSCVSDAVYTENGFEGYDYQPTGCGGHAILCIAGGIRGINWDCYQNGYGIYNITTPGTQSFGDFFQMVSVEQCTKAGAGGFLFDGGTGPTNSDAHAVGGVDRANVWNVTMEACRVQQCPGSGVTFFGVNEVDISDLYCYSNGLHGMYTASSGGVPTSHIKMTNGMMRENVGSGLYVNQMTTDSSFTNVHGRGNGVNSFNIVISGINTGYIVLNGCNARRRGFPGGDYLNNAAGPVLASTATNFLHD